MIIELPKEYSRIEERKGKVAFIENGILYISKQVSFRKIMAEITYQMKGRDECGFCHRTVTEDKMTVDHLFPQEFGGPTIPDNLLPACKRCNARKQNMTYEQFLIYESKGDKKSKRKYLINEVMKLQEEVRKKKLYQIPQEWLTDAEVDDVIVNMRLYEDYLEKRYFAFENYYFKYGNIQKPIILDRNHFLLEGFYQIMIAKNNMLKSLPAILLENVEVFLRIRED